jgi:hypothetical protein
MRPDYFSDNLLSGCLHFLAHSLYVLNTVFKFNFVLIDSLNFLATLYSKQAHKPSSKNRRKILRPLCMPFGVPGALARHVVLALDEIRFEVIISLYCSLQV